MRTGTEYGFLIGQALQNRRFVRAQALLEDAVISLPTAKGGQDYRRPLSDIFTDTRTTELFESCGARTVEDFYRTHPLEFEERAEQEFASKQEIERQSNLVYRMYSPRLHGLVYPRVVRLLLLSDILNVYDVCNTPPQRLKKAVSSPGYLPQLMKIQREYGR